MKKYILAALSVFLLVSFDQWTKMLAVSYLKGKPSIVLIPHVFELTYLENTGAAFGILENQRPIFLLLTPIVTLLILYLFIRLPKGRRFIPLHVIAVFLTAGAIGNMIDRVFQGYVVDFFYFSFINFPVFNIADIYVTVTGIIFAFYYLFYYKEEEFDFLHLDIKGYKKKK